MSKKKVLLIRTAHGEPKIDTYNVQQIGMGKEFVKRGYDVDIVFNCKSKKDKQLVYEENGKEVNIIWMKGFEILRDAIFFPLLKKGALKEYDLVICNEYNQIMSYLLAKNHCGENLALYNGPYYNMFFIPFADKLFDAVCKKKINKAYKVKFTKSVLATEYLQKRKQENIITLGVGLDAAKFDCVVENEQVKGIKEYLQNNNCILYVGQFVPRKNFDFLIKVFKRVLQTDPNVKLVLIGKGKDKYISKCLSVLTDKEKESVKMFGMIENTQMKFIYPYAKVFLLPSILEIFGMVLLEAMYFGTPVIASENGGSLTCIKNGQNGFIIKQFDEKLWAEKVLYLLKNNDLRKEIGDKAHCTIENEYTWSALVDKILQYC